MMSLAPSLYAQPVSQTTTVLLTNGDDFTTFAPGGLFAVDCQVFVA
jgi:hypothetical protein